MPLTIFNQSAHGAGNAPDTTPLDIDLNPPAMRLDLAIFDNSALVSFSADGRNFGTERELPAGVISSLDILVRKMRIRNKTVASVARYDFTAYYDPIEIVGRPFQPVP
jgi:hypothetical protein